MTIELWYDPVYTEIKTKINGKWQNHADIFGFLYPVRHYSLQTWLREAGSWSGLERQIIDLARGEAVALTFHGRETDFQDLKSTLADCSMIHTEYQIWDAEGFYNQKIKNVNNYLQRYPFPVVEERNVLNSILNFSKDEDVWMQCINQESDWMDAEASMRPCIVVGEDYPINYEVLHRLERLTRSLRRPAEAICCLFKDGEQQKIIQNYAAQFQGMHFSFLSSGDTLDEMKEKYGIPYCLRQKVKKTSQMWEALVEHLDYLKDRNRIADLLCKQQNSHLTPEEKQELADLNEISSWIYSAGGWLEELKNMKSSHAIDTLEGGVPK